MTSLDKLIRDVCADELDDPDYKLYESCMRLAHSAMRDLSIFVLPNKETFKVRTEVLGVYGRQIVNLPNDVVNLLKVGICVNGRIVVLGVSDDFCWDGEDITCGCREEADEEINSILSGGSCGTGWNFENAYWNGDNIGGLFGYGGGYNRYGYYQYDRTNNRILLEGIPDGADLVVEYQSNGVGDGLKTVPTEAENAIKYFVIWRKKKDQTARRDYIIEYNKLKRIYNSYTATEWRQFFLNNTKSSPKR